MGLCEEKENMWDKSEPDKTWNREKGDLGLRRSYMPLGQCVVCRNSVMRVATAVFRRLYQWKITHGCLWVMGPVRLALPASPAKAWCNAPLQGK